MTNNIVIDFQDYGLNEKDISKVDDACVKRLGDEMVHAFKTFGYCYVKNHGVDEKFINEYFTVSRSYFEQPDEMKEKYAIDSEYAFGWVKMEGEKCDPKSEKCDLHEAFNYRPFSGHESWPDVRDFQVLTEEVFKIGMELGYRFCDALSLGLNQPKHFLRDAHKLVGQQGNSSAMRTLYYPPIEDDYILKESQTRIGEHTDFGTFSLGFQDDVGGLEIRGPGKEFVSTDPIPGTVLVYVGAMIQRWTADSIIATLHRIPVPTDERRRKSLRQSFVWFQHPDDDYMVKCLDGSDKYRPVSHKEYANTCIREAMPWLDPTVRGK